MVKKTESVATGNLLASLPGPKAKESFEALAAGAGVDIERIVSRGQASPEGFWYDQPRREWVVVLEGAARLEIEGVPEPLELGAGDWVDLPAHRRHRVQWTTPDQPTIWLAVHF